VLEELIWASNSEAFAQLSTFTINHILEIKSSLLQLQASFLTPRIKTRI